MKAWRVHQHGPFRESMRLEDVEPPVCSGNECVVRVEATALNFPDLLAISGAYQLKPALPFIPGMELTGEVIAVGAACPFKVGDHLMSMGLGGGFAEQAVVSPETCYRVPAGMPAADAAAFQMIYQTSYFALVHRARIQKGETLLVHGGAGGVGSAAIQLGKHLGATVIATAGSAEKLEVCRRAGAAHAINYVEQDFVEEVKRLTNGRGADVIYDPVGGDVFDKSTRCIAWEGRLVVVGFTSGRIPTIAANRILLKNMAVVGLQWGVYKLQNPGLCAETQTVLEKLYAQGAIKPEIFPTRFSMTQVPEALATLEERRSYGKVLVIP